MEYHKLGTLVHPYRCNELIRYYEARSLPNEKPEKVKGQLSHCVINMLYLVNAFNLKHYFPPCFFFFFFFLMGVTPPVVDGGRVEGELWHAYFAQGQ